MPSYDVHQHLWPKPLVEALRARSEPPRLAGKTLELHEGSFRVDLRAHELEERLSLLDGDGVDVAVVSLQPTLGAEKAPELLDAYHDGVRELVTAADGRLRAFTAGACLDGFAGACVSAQAVVDGLGELPAELERTGQVLFVHPGPPARLPSGMPDWWAAVVDYTAQMQSAYAAWIARGVQRHPLLAVVFALLAGGAPFQLERLRSRGVETQTAFGSRIYLDSASYGRRALELCLEAYGGGQLVYGSDVPVIDPGPTLRALGELGEAVSDAVRKENPTRLFS